MKKIAKRILTSIIVVIMMVSITPSDNMLFTDLLQFFSINSTVVAATIPTFSLNLISETNTEVELSVNLDSGTYNNACFELTYSANISKCTSIVAGTQLNKHMDAHRDKYGSCCGIDYASNTKTSKVAIASVYNMDNAGSYFVFTFKKAKNNYITASDLQLVVHDIEAKVINNISNQPQVVITKPTFSLNLVSETNSEVVLAINLENGSFNNCCYEITYSSNIRKCSNIVEGSTLLQHYQKYGKGRVTYDFYSVTSKSAIASVDDMNVKGQYFIYTFEKKYSNSITANDFTLKELDIDCYIINRLPQSGTNKVSTNKLIGVDVNNIDMKYKSSAEINPVVLTSGNVNYSIVYSSADCRVVSVDDNGTVHANKKGSTTITCYVVDDSGNMVKDECVVNVNYSFGQWLIRILLFGWLWY